MSLHLQSIERACQKANPKLLELSFGCRVNAECGVRTVNYIIPKDKHGEEMVVYCPFMGGSAESDFTSFIKNKVIGHPITLQDILLCLGTQFSIDGDGYIWRRYPNSFPDLRRDENGEIIIYDLTKSPYDQSEEVLQFLAENLTK